MDISKEISILQSRAEDNMKRYADERILMTLRALQEDNPSLLMEDMNQTISRRGIMYGCMHDRCSRVACVRGYCEIHAKKTPYELMGSGANDTRKNMFSF